ncbi:MAG: TVP38/TMEM64 family protein [Coriobacteriales bacterium]|jgi:uncharacterized membrane protein YdjX (TVP38/TMEM64 family)|nr:TVP38/TMEM64 family protein [Coriobacteriales bacterium]
MSAAKDRRGVLPDGHDGVGDGGHRRGAGAGHGDGGHNGTDDKRTSDTTGAPKAKPKVSTADKVKFAGLIAFFILIIAASVLAVFYINSLGTDSLQEKLEYAIKEAGVFGILICLGVQFVQVVVAFIPGEVVQVAIGYVYGTIGGGFITLAGALFSSVFVFYLVRKLGAPFVQGMVGGKDSGRLKFLHDSKNLNSLVFILYLIPGLPKDVFNYVVPLTKMQPSAFFVLSTIARAPAIFASTFVAASFKSGDYIQMAIVAAVFGGLGLFGIIFNQRIMGFVDRLVTRLSPRHRTEHASGEGAPAASTASVGDGKTSD